jgi:hypothetical protein
MFKDWERLKDLVKKRLAVSDPRTPVYRACDNLFINIWCKNRYKTTVSTSLSHVAVAATFVLLLDSVGAPWRPL